MSKFPVALFLAAAAAGSALAQVPPKPEAMSNWPQWRGPLMTGEAPRSNPPAEWSDKQNIRWKVRIPGLGHASPVVWGDRVFVLTAVKADATPEARLDAPGTPLAASPAVGPAAHFATLSQDPPATRPAPEAGERPRRRGEGGGRGEGGRRGEPAGPRPMHKYIVMALDRKTGDTVWERVVREEAPHEGAHQTASEASPSPITDGEHIFAHFGSRGLYCLDWDGKVVWNVDLGDMRIRNQFGEGSTPALFGNFLIVLWDHQGEDFIVALDKRTGKEIWRQERDEPTNWSTPLVVEQDGVRQVIANGTRRVRSYELETGKLLWETGGMTDNVIPSPVYHDGIVYVMSGFRGAAARAIRLADARGELGEDSSAILWKYSRNTPYVPSPLLHADRLYFFDVNRPVLTCLNARDGSVVYGPQRLEGMDVIYASPVAAAGRIYVMSREGTVLVLKAGDTFEVLKKIEMDEGIDASPALAGDEMFVRGARHLYCIAKD